MEASERLAEEARGIYLYCLFSGKEPPLPGVKGLDGEELSFIAYQDLKALVGYVPLAEFNEEAMSQHLQDVEWWALRVQHHQEVIQYIINLQPTVPLKFCTIFKSKGKLLGLLRRHYQELSSFLGYIRDKEEWGVKVYAQEGPLTEAALQALKENLSTIPPGEAYLLGKKREAIIHQQAGRFLDNLSDEIYRELRSFCQDSRKNRPWAKGVAGRDQEMILNAALLLKREDGDRLQVKLKGLAKNYEGHRLLFETSGPWPPYNFCPKLEGD